jgi:hypothetical protein
MIYSDKNKTVNHNAILIKRFTAQLSTEILLIKNVHKIFFVQVCGHTTL